MTPLSDIQAQHSAGQQLIGFDYQFYYFMYLALDLKTGQKIGFEVKDDVHIDNVDGTTTLFQTKHTSATNADGSPSNLTTLDSDLWKTLSLWAAMIKADKNVSTTHSFYLVTNKSEASNKLIEALALYKSDENIEAFLEAVKQLKSKTEDETIKAYIESVEKLPKKALKSFLQKLVIVTGMDDIIIKIKTRILECVKSEDLIDAVFDSLSSNLNLTKYLEIKDRSSFEITFDDFNRKFGKCFRVAFEKKPLPKRQLPMVFPERLEDQIFIKQLIDLGGLSGDTKEILDLTTIMLRVINYLEDWKDNNAVLPTEVGEFEGDTLRIWKNEFTAKYRQVKSKVDKGIAVEGLEDEIKVLALELLDIIRRQNVSIAGENLGIELSNGYYYSLSNTPSIGWHFDWERKYNKV